MQDGGLILGRGNHAQVEPYAFGGFLSLVQSNSYMLSCHRPPSDKTANTLTLSNYRVPALLKMLQSLLV
jgi:hypothetical protein